MSLSLTLPTTSAINWKPAGLRYDWQSILRTPTVKVTAEVLSLISLSIGLLSLWLGLSWL